MPIRSQPFASQYPGIDHLPLRPPAIDKYGHAWCLSCLSRNGHAVAGDGICDECRARNHARPEHKRIMYGHGVTRWECGRCHQQHSVHLAGTGPIPPNVCEQCQQQDREPQGESMRLFTPAPDQIPGQLGF